MEKINYYLHKEGFYCLYIFIDIIHYFLFRKGYEHPVGVFMEALYEISEVTLIKLILVFISTGLFILERKKGKNKWIFFWVNILGITMIFFSIKEGALRHILFFYSSISLWILFLMGVFQIVWSIKQLKRKNSKLRNKPTV